jgi:hypothetical protein
MTASNPGEHRLTEPDFVRVDTVAADGDLPQLHDPLDLLPLRQHVSTTIEVSRAFAGPCLLEVLSRPQRFRILRHGEGAQILAAGERALSEARALLSHTYGDGVEFGATAVHTYVDPRTDALMVPVLFARVDAPRAHAADLRALLDDRGARMQEVTLQRDRVVIRAHVALQCALGLEQAIHVLTCDVAQVLSWLVGYQPAISFQILMNGDSA